MLLSFNLLTHLKNKRAISELFPIKIQFDLPSTKERVLCKHNMQYTNRNMLKTLSPENTRVNINAASHISFSLSYNLFGEFISFTHFQANKSGHFARTKNKFSPSQGFLTFPSKLNCGNKISLRHVLSANLTNQDTTLPYMAMVSLF